MRTEAEKRAHRKYQNKVRNTTKAQLNCTIDRTDYNMIDNYCKEKGISKAQFIVTACKKYIDEN